MRCEPGRNSTWNPVFENELGRLNPESGFIFAAKSRFFVLYVKNQK